jgi:hypothetical protein
VTIGLAFAQLLCELLVISQVVDGFTLLNRAITNRETSFPVRGQVFEDDRVD